MSENNTDQPRDPGRRRALGAIGLVAAGALAGRVTAGIPLPRAQTPEEAAEEAKTNAQKQEAEKDRLLQLRKEFESKKQLDVFSSKPSNKGWTIRYPRSDEKVSYTPKGETDFSYGHNPQSPKDPSKGPDYVTYPTIMLNGESIGFTAEPYTTLDGKETILLDSKSQSELFPSGDRWLLRPEEAQTESDPKIDSRVVVFEKPETGEAHYLQIRLRQPIRQQQLRPFEKIDLTEMQPRPTTA